MTLINLCPTEIRFMHDKINFKFRCGGSVNETVEKISLGRMSVQDLPTIRVVFKNGTYCAFDNRRLYIYRVLHWCGKLDEVTVKQVSLSLFKPSRFTTKNNGNTVRMRGGLGLPHSCATT